MNDRSSFILASLAVCLALFFAFSAAKVSLFSGAPSGWDYFYHERVVSLSIEEGTLLPFDPLSAGGRTHTYLPFFHSLVVALSLSAGIPGEIFLRASSPVFLFLSALSIFLFSGRKKQALLALAFFSAFPDVLLFSASSGMPSVASLFFLSILVFSLFSGKPIGTGLFAMLSLSLGALHQISALSFLVFSALIFISRRDWQVLLFGALSIVAPVLWALLFKTTVPNWGKSPGLATLANPPFPLHIILPISILALDFIFMARDGKKAEAFFLSGIFLFLSFFSPVLPSRFLLYLGFFLSLWIGQVSWKSWAIFGLSLALVLSTFGTLKWTAPILQAEDREGLFWIDSNIPGRAVLGHTDLTSVFLIGHAKTVIDGYSEGLPDAYERQAGIKNAYETGDFSGISGKYGANFLYTNEGERRILGEFREPGPVLFSNGYCRILGIAN